MGWKGFRARISITRKSSKTVSTPEFYRKISQSEFHPSGSRSNGAGSSTQNRPQQSVTGGVSHLNNEDIQRNQLLQKDRENQSISQTRNDFKQSGNASSINGETTTVTIETVSANQLKDAKSDVEKDSAYCKPIRTTERGKVDEIEMQI